MLSFVICFTLKTFSELTKPNPAHVDWRLLMPYKDIFIANNNK